MSQPPSPTPSSPTQNFPITGPIFGTAGDLLQSPIHGDLVDLPVPPHVPAPIQEPAPLSPVPVATSHLADLFMSVAGLGSFLLHAWFISEWTSFRAPTVGERHQRIEAAPSIADEVRAIDMAIGQLECCRKTNLEWLRRHAPYELINYNNSVNNGWGNTSVTSWFRPMPSRSVAVALQVLNH
jgi:hypothetical protein